MSPSKSSSFFDDEEEEEAILRTDAGDDSDVMSPSSSSSLCPLLVELLSFVNVIFAVAVSDGSDSNSPSNSSNSPLPAAAAGDAVPLNEVMSASNSSAPLDNGSTALALLLLAGFAFALAAPTSAIKLSKSSIVQNATHTATLFFFFLQEKFNFKFDR
jgi:hypothetical protein